MVCVPCFIIPVLLWLWHRFLQPIVLRYWNPWEKKDAEGNVIAPQFPFQCAGGQCPFPRKQQIENSENDSNEETNKTEEKQSNKSVNISEDLIGPIILEDKKEN